MKKLPLRFLSEASEEISETRFWYESQRSGLGEEFLSQLNHSLNEIQSRPLSFPLMTATAHRAILRRFPYCIYFAVREDDLVVLAVLYGGRKPDIWKRRWTQ